MPDLANIYRQRQPQSPRAANAPVDEPLDEVSANDGFDAGDVAGGVAAGAAGLGGLYALSKMPGSIGKIAKLVNSARMQLMLSGLAVPKSALGNVGATAIASAERGSTKPLRELFSRQTARDAVQGYRNAAQVGPAAAGARWHGPGRLMGALDEATRNALRRGGLSADEAERAVLQSPLNKDLADALDSPAAQYAIPFRRTPFNQFTEGLKTYKPENLRQHPAISALVHGAGAAHGAATADDEYPLSVGLGTAAAARYGLPYAVGAIVGRDLAGGRQPERLAGSALPVSEYGLASGITQPLRPFYRPAIRTLLGE